MRRGEADFVQIVLNDAVDTAGGELCDDSGAASGGIGADGEFETDDGERLRRKRFELWQNLWIARQGERELRRVGGNFPAVHRQRAIIGDGRGHDHGAKRSGREPTLKLSPEIGGRGKRFEFARGFGSGGAFAAQQCDAMTKFIQGVGERGTGRARADVGEESHRIERLSRRARGEEDVHRFGSAARTSATI